jgi:hypothetical protein
MLTTAHNPMLAFLLMFGSFGCSAWLLPRADSCWRLTVSVALPLLLPAAAAFAHLI